MDLDWMRQEIISALFQAKAYEVRPEDPFIFTAKTLGVDYIDHGALAKYPLQRAIINENMSNYISEYIGLDNFDIITGGVVRDLIFTIPVAEILGKPYVIIRSEPKYHGRGGRTVGLIEEGERALNIADLITGGKSAIKWIDVIREEGGMINDFVANMDRLQGGEQTLDEKGVKLHSMVQRNRGFYETAVELEEISYEQLEQVNKFNQNPRQWGIDYLRERPGFILDHITVNPDGTLRNKDGILMFTEPRAYPELKEEFSDAIVSHLKKLQVKEAVPELGYTPA